MIVSKHRRLRFVISARRGGIGEEEEEKEEEEEEEGVKERHEQECAERICN